MVEQLFTTKSEETSGGQETRAQLFIARREEQGKIESEKRRWGERGENDETEDTIMVRKEMNFFVLAGILAPYSQRSDTGE